MENITRTAYGSYLQTCLLMGLPFSMMANTTLNEKFGIQSGIAPDISERPTMRYYTIGNGGHKMTSGADGLSKPEPIQHRATDGAAFNHIPFVLREPEADLSNAERQNYGLRRQEQHNDVTYIAYYLKRIPMGSVVPALELKSVVDGVETTNPFVPDSSNLNPTPPVLNPEGVNLTNGDYTTATAKLVLQLTPADVAELLNVASILYNDEGFAIISEIGLVSGIDRLVESPGVGNTTITFNEVIAAQIVSHLNAFYPLNFANNGTEIIIDVGATEPLFSLS